MTGRHFGLPTCWISRSSLCLSASSNGTVIAWTAVRGASSGFQVSFLSFARALADASFASATAWANESIPSKAANLANISSAFSWSKSISIFYCFPPCEETRTLLVSWRYWPSWTRIAAAVSEFSSPQVPTQAKKASRLWKESEMEQNGDRWKMILTTKQLHSSYEQVLKQNGNVETVYLSQLGNRSHVPCCGRSLRRDLTPEFWTTLSIEKQATSKSCLKIQLLRYSESNSKKLKLHEMMIREATERESTLTIELAIHRIWFRGSCSRRRSSFLFLVSLGFPLRALSTIWILLSIPPHVIQLWEWYQLLKS